MPYCKVVLTNPSQTFLNSLSYLVPETLVDKLNIGSLVLVPFRNHKENGLIVDIYSESRESDQGFKIREVEDLLYEDFCFNQELIELVKFVADYYCCSYAEVVNGILPTALIPKPEKIIRLSTLALENLEQYQDDKLIPILSKARGKQAKFTRLKTLSKLKDNELKKEIRKLQSKNLVEISFADFRDKKEGLKTNPLDRLKDLDSRIRPELTQEQSQVLDSIRNSDKSRFLIHGVTGSGKTEIYLRLMEDCFARSQSAIFLVPEISLAPQLVERISQRFGQENVLIWHSALSKSEKEFTLSQLIIGEPKVIVGARSAIFAPVNNLGLIVMDEEHENSYKQDSPSPRYHARLVAEKRAEFNHCNLVLGSATPNVETYYKALNNIEGYELLKLSKRVFDNPLPEVSLIDMREEFNNANKSIFSRSLKSRIDEALERKEQVILFLNKRGSASHVFCRNCGFVYKCNHCDSKIVYHSDRQLMICHHCNYSEKHPDECPVCNSRAIKFFGLGTQKLEEETRKAYPQANIKRLDSDVSKVGHSYIDTWNDFKEGKVDILIGTQMIAKGLDNPNLTVVGVISADSNFSQLDYMADERGFQLLTQVAGRAGRKDKIGSVIFQSYQPDREVLLDAKTQDYEKFYTKEIDLRKAFLYPPFSKIIRFLISSENEILSIESGNKIHELLFNLLKEFNIKVSNLDQQQVIDSQRTISILGPCPALISKIKNKYRYHIVLKIPRLANNLDQTFISRLKEDFLKFKKPDQTLINIDIDNISLY